MDALRVAFQRAGDGERVDSDRLERWAKAHRSGKGPFLHFLESWGRELRDWFERSYFRLDDPRSEQARGLLILVTVVGTAGAVVLGGAVGPLVLPVGAVLLVVALRALPRRTPEAALEVRRWEAFRRFLTDFSAMEDAGPRLLPLWEHYLVYATALGVADRLLDNLDRLARHHPEASPTPGWYRPGRRGPVAFSDLASVARSVDNLRGLAQALSSSTRTGGGFSRGGGGGGGGGRSRAG